MTAPRAAAPARAPKYYGREAPYIPVEFSGAAYRFGHSMVRAELRHPANSVPTIFRPPDGAEPGDDDLSGFRDLPAALVIEWDRFFWKDAIQGQTNSSLRINNRISPAMFRVPDRGPLAAAEPSARACAGAAVRAGGGGGDG